MAFLIVLGILAVIAGIIIWTATSSPVAFVIGLCILIMFIVGTNTRLYALTTALGALAIAIYYLAGGEFWVYILVIALIGLMKGMKFFANREEMWEVWEEDETFDEKLYRWVYNEDASEFLLMLLCLPCTLFYVLLGLPALSVAWLAFLPAAFLFYRFIRVVKTTDDWDWD